MWRRTWKLKIKGKIKHFLWRAFHNILPTGHRLNQKGISTDEICMTCGDGIETLEHLFFHCRKSQLIWQLSPVLWEGFQPHTSNFQTWWTQACLTSKQEMEQSRLEISAYIFWSLWKMRNDWRFNSSTVPAFQVIQRAQNEWLEFSDLLQKKRQQQSNFQLSPPLQPSEPHPDLVGCCTISISSNFQLQAPPSSTALLARNSSSNLQQAVALLRTEVSDPISLNLEAVRSALLLAHQLGWNRINLQIEDHEIVQMVQAHQHIPVRQMAISEDIKLLTHLFDVCLFSLITKEENTICRRIANFALDCPYSVTWTSNFPPWMS